MVTGLQPSPCLQAGQGGRVSLLWDAVSSAPTPTVLRLPGCGRLHPHPHCAPPPRCASQQSGGFPPPVADPSCLCQVRPDLLNLGSRTCLLFAFPDFTSLVSLLWASLSDSVKGGAWVSGSYRCLTLGPYYSQQRGAGTRNFQKAPR